MNKLRWIKPTLLWMTLVFVSMGGATLLYTTLQTEVVLAIDGEARNIKTFVPSVEELLKQENVTVAPHDYLSVSKKAKLVDGMTIVHKKATRVFVEKDGNRKEMWVFSDTIDKVLKEKGIFLGEHDYLSVPLETKVESDLSFVIETGKKVVFEDGAHQPKEMWTVQDTLEAFLKEKNVILGEKDQIETSEGNLVNGQKIKINRITVKEAIIEKEVAFAIEKKKDPNLTLGKEKVIQKGENGKVSETYAVTYQNNTETGRKLVKKQETKKVKNQMIAIGTKKVTVSRGYASSGKEIVVTSTAYTASCKGCSGKTATGINLKDNPHLKVIAVDPKIIPLGTKVWVEGYGYAIAGDKGSAIKGHKIDVFIPTKSAAKKWGRKKVKIRIL